MYKRQVLSQNDLQRGVIETFVQESPVLDRLPLMPIEGNAYAYNKEATLPGVAFRDVNEAYTESTGTFVQATEGLKILGGDADVDRFLVQTRGNLNDQRAAQTRLKVKAAAYAFQNEFINGDVSVNVKGFDGLKKRLTGAQVIASANSAASMNADDTARNFFFDDLETAIAAAKAGSGNAVIYTHRTLIAKIKSAGRRVGGVEMVKEDMTGKRVVMWNGIAVLDIGQTAAGADIIPVTTGKTDLYVVRFGQDESDGAVTGLTNGGIDVRDLGEIDAKPVFRTRIEFYCGLATFGGNAAARVSGITV